jgi:hypothetical protein
MSRSAIEKLDAFQEQKPRIVKLIRPSDIRKAKEEELRLRNEVLLQTIVEQTQVQKRYKIVLKKPSASASASASINSDQHVHTKEKVLENVKEMPPKKRTSSTGEYTSEKQIESENRHTVLVKSFEKSFDVLPVDDVEVVHLTLFQYNDKAYFRDTVSNTVFSKLGPKSVGSKVGRWDPKKKCICVDILDSS